MFVIYSEIKISYSIYISNLIVFYFECEYILHANNISGKARIQRSDFKILGRFLATRKVDDTTGSR